MSKRIDYIGNRYGELTVVTEVTTLERRGRGRYFWFDCSCGGKIIARLDGVSSGLIKSCGHLQKAARKTRHVTKAIFG